MLKRHVLSRKHGVFQRSERQRDADVFDCFAYGEIDTRRTYLLSQTAAPLLQGGTKPCGFNSPVGFIRIYAPK